MTTAQLMANSMAFLTQLPLDIGLDDRYTFETFYTDHQPEAVKRLKAFASGDGEQCLYLYGAGGSGKSHALQAMCQQERSGSFYLPLSKAKEYGPSCLQGMAHLSLVALDDIDDVILERPWAEAIFHLFNELRDAGGRIVVSASADPDRVNCVLTDLRSRLKWGDIVALNELDDDQKLALLKQRSELRGMEMNDDVAIFLTRRASRDLKDLIQLLDQLDKASIAAQRKLTIPFVKQVLGLD